MFVVVPNKIETTRAPTSVKPAANAAFVIINVVAFFLQSAGWSLSLDSSWFSVITYGFAHASPWHLIANMYVLLLVGNPVNRRIGNFNYVWAFLGTLLFLGVTGRVVQLGPLMGSSGVIFAIIAIFLMLMPSAVVNLAYIALFPVTVLIGFLQKTESEVDWFIRWGTFQLRAVCLLLVVPIIEIWGFIWWRISLGAWQWNHPAHLLGFFCGVVIVLLLPSRITMKVPESI